jgi:hypothetical protein
VDLWRRVPHARHRRGCGLDATRSTTTANSARRSFLPIDAGSAMLPCTRTSVFSLLSSYRSPYFYELRRISACVSVSRGTAGASKGRDLLEPARTGNSALPARLLPTPNQSLVLLLLRCSADPSPLQMGLLYRERRATS